MDSQRWLRLKELFRQAIERPIAERSEFVATHCDDDALRIELENLLRFHDSSPGFLEPPLPADAESDPSLADPMLGKSLRGFQILRRIGSGGMGIVYEARQENPNRLAAVKFLQPNCITSQNLWRFARESESLAKLQHSGIAQIYAAGTLESETGNQPWFAMELIDGQPLHLHCRLHSLSIRQKLELLIDICDAVQHAHTRGIIHRDLKPANILIVKDCVEATETVELNWLPKIVDFGLALDDFQAHRSTMHTATGDILGTLNYMSPERFSGDASLVDVRCDVYAIGAIGFEMLAGRLPHEHPGSSVAESIRHIEQDDPPSLGMIDKKFRGDLEIIFAKALDKDLLRRYASVESLSADLRRFLIGEPIIARPASFVYRIQKFARRNRVLVLGVLSTTASLIIGMVMFANEAQKAQREADRSEYEATKARAINDFLVNDFMMKLLAAANSRTTNERLPVSKLVDDASAKISSTFAGHPLQEAAVRNEVGTIYFNLGEYKQALEQYQLAMNLWDANLGSNHPDTLKVVNNVGYCCLLMGKQDEAGKYLKQALDGRTSIFGESDSRTQETIINYAEWLQMNRRTDEAESMLRRSIDLQKQAYGLENRNTLTSIANLGSILTSRGRYEEGLPLHCTVYETSCKMYGDDHVLTLQAASRYGQTLLQVGQAKSAKAIIVPNLEAFERTLGPTHQSTIISRRLLARIYKALGDMPSAQNQLELALDAAQSQSELPGSVFEKIRDELKKIAR